VKNKKRGAKAPQSKRFTIIPGGISDVPILGKFQIHLKYEI